MVLRSKALPWRFGSGQVAMAPVRYGTTLTLIAVSPFPDAMSDEQELPFYGPNYRPPPATRNRPAEPLWNFWVAGVTWSCELWFHGASYGWEAQILRNGDLFMARSALVTKPAAVQCAEEMRNGGEKGYLEAVEIGEQRSRSVGQSSTIAVELARVFDANAIQNGI